jgi:WD40 repeat protein
LEHLPFSDANKGRVCAAGFDNGIVRILAITADGIDILKSFKAHDDAIAGIKFTKDLKMCCTASKTGDVFFFEIDGNMDIQKFDPLCTVKLPENSGVNDFKWNQDDNSIIFGCNNGYVFEIRRPKASEIDNKDSYLWENPDIKTWKIKIMEF